MPTGTITGQVGTSYSYYVDIEWDTTTVDDRVEKLTAIADKIELEVATVQDEADEIDNELVALQIQLDAAILANPQGKDSEVTRLIGEIASTQARFALPAARLADLNAQLLSINASKFKWEFINTDRPIGNPIDSLAYYTGQVVETLTMPSYSIGEVVVLIALDDDPANLRIAESLEEPADYTRLVSEPMMGDFAVLYAYAMGDAAKKWRPYYLTGTVLSKENNMLNVQASNGETFKAAATYMTCNEDAFIAGDSIIIDMNGRSDGIVIGFESSPRSCVQFYINYLPNYNAGNAVQITDTNVTSVAGSPRYPGTASKSATAIDINTVEICTLSWDDTVVLGLFGGERVREYGPHSYGLWESEATPCYGTLEECSAGRAKGAASYGTNKDTSLTGEWFNDDLFQSVMDYGGLSDSISDTKNIVASLSSGGYTSRSVSTKIHPITSIPRSGDSTYYKWITTELATDTEKRQSIDYIWVVDSSGEATETLLGSWTTVETRADTYDPWITSYPSRYEGGPNYALFEFGGSLYYDDADLTVLPPNTEIDSGSAKILTTAGEPVVTS